MKNLKLASASALSIVTVSFASGAQAGNLTLCRAAWDPANALVELSKAFEAQSGHNMSFEFIPRPNFADRMLNDFFDAEGISMGDCADATVCAYST